jgi:prepilin-type N-terminal cleavage/methylation domain-containing protein
MKQKKGFTLIELLVTIGLLVLLAVLFIPGYQQLTGQNNIQGIDVNKFHPNDPNRISDNVSGPNSIPVVPDESARVIGSVYIFKKFENDGWLGIHFSKGEAVRFFDTNDGNLADKCRNEYAEGIEGLNTYFERNGPDFLNGKLSDAEIAILKDAGFTIFEYYIDDGKELPAFNKIMDLTSLQ